MSNLLLKDLVETIKSAGLPEITQQIYVHPDTWKEIQERIGRADGRETMRWMGVEVCISTFCPRFNDDGEPLIVKWRKENGPPFPLPFPGGLER